jgi:hypothetical protein
MRWKDSQEDAIAVAKIYELGREMAAVAVKDEKSVTASRFLLREALKYLLQPSQIYIVVAPSRL